MYFGRHGLTPSTSGSKWLMVALDVAAAGLAAWFLFGGDGPVADLFGLDPDRAGLVRRVLLASLAVIYCVRFLGTLWMQHRKVEWSGAVVVGVWVLIIQATMAYLGGTNAARVGVLTWIGVVLYAVGSYLNTGSELQRRAWKRQPGHQGRLYTGGLWASSRHINYFGDATLFTGFALVAGRPLALVIPMLMVLSFEFGHIPMLERHLAKHYGSAFQRYAERTARFVPRFHRQPTPTGSGVPWTSTRS